MYSSSLPHPNPRYFFFSKNSYFHDENSRNSQTSPKTKPSIVRRAITVSATRGFSIWEPWWMSPWYFCLRERDGIRGSSIYIRVDGHLSSSGRRCNYGFWHRDPASRLRVRHISRIIGCFIKRCHAHVACHSIIHSDIRRYLYGVENREGRADRTK